MAKITRFSGNLQAFASAAIGAERTIFGSVTQANDLTSQINADFLRGWGIVGPSDQPTIEDFNGAMYTHGQLLAYLHQAGVAEYNSAQEYHAGSITNASGVLYRSLVDNNTGNTPSSSPLAWFALTAAATDAIAGIAPNAFRNIAVYRRIGGVQQVSVNGAAFTSTGASSFIFPASGVAKKRVWGGGGGGGGVSGASAAASGGNGGGYSEGITKASPGVSESVTVGVGGAGGVGAGAGATGGSSSAGTFSATGGGGGVGTNSGTVAANTSTFGAGSGGQFNVGGAGASGSFQAAGYIASGGGGSYGSSPSPNTTGVGAIGNFPGGAGSGGSNINNGGAGADGCVIYEY